jgi:hypothetical protein
MKIGLVEWLKMRALSSNPNTEKKKQKNKKPYCRAKAARQYINK